MIVDRVAVVTASKGALMEYDGDIAPIQAYMVRPDASGPRPAIIVIHDIYGLSEHTEDVADRFAREGYVALAPNLFSRPDIRTVLTPKRIGDAVGLMSSVPPGKRGDESCIRELMSQRPESERKELQETMGMLYEKLPRERMCADLAAAVRYLNDQPFVAEGKVGSVGFCFGGGLSINLACRTTLAACVVFYGENPSPLELVQHIKCPVLGLYGAEDTRITANLDKLVKSMTEYKKDFEMRVYPGAAHAFFNDTNERSYRPDAAKEAWTRVLGFCSRTLKS